MASNVFFVKSTSSLVIKDPRQTISSLPNMVLDQLSADMVLLNNSRTHKLKSNSTSTSRKRSLALQQLEEERRMELEERVRREQRNKEYLDKKYSILEKQIADDDLISFDDEAQQRSNDIIARPSDINQWNMGSQSANHLAEIQIQRQNCNVYQETVVPVRNVLVGNQQVSTTTAETMNHQVIKPTKSIETVAPANNALARDQQVSNISTAEIVKVQQVIQPANSNTTSHEDRLCKKHLGKLTKDRFSLKEPRTEGEPMNEPSSQLYVTARNMFHDVQWASNANQVTTNELKQKIVGNNRQRRQRESTSCMKIQQRPTISLGIREIGVNTSNGYKSGSLPQDKNRSKQRRPISHDDRALIYEVFIYTSYDKRMGFNIGENSVISHQGFHVPRQSHPHLIISRSIEWFMVNDSTIILSMAHKVQTGMNFKLGERASETNADANEQVRQLIICNSIFEVPSKFGSDLANPEEDRSSGRKCDVIRNQDISLAIQYLSRIEDRKWIQDCETGGSVTITDDNTGSCRSPRIKIDLAIRHKSKYVI